MVKSIVSFICIIFIIIRGGREGRKRKTDREKMGERGQNKRKQQNTRETHLDDIERDARRSFGFRFAHGRIFSHDE